MMIRTSQKGFSLIELMVAMVITLVAVGSIYQVFRSVNKSYRSRAVAEEAEQNLRIAMDYIIRDLRMAGYDPRDTKRFGMITANSNMIEFSTDLNENGVIDVPNSTNPQERIGYRLNGKNLEKMVINDVTDEIESGVLVADVTNLIFTYFDGTNPPATMQDISAVDIEMTLERFPDPLNRSKSLIRTLASRVRFRNLNLN